MARKERHTVGVMMRVGSRKAFLRDGAWRCADSALEADLNRIMDEWIQATGGPNLTSGNPEAEAAQEMARRLGGSVMLVTEANRGQVRDVWLARRQYRLEF